MYIELLQTMKVLKTEAGTIRKNILCLSLVSPMTTVTPAHPIFF